MTTRYEAFECIDESDYEDCNWGNLGSPRDPSELQEEILRAGISQEEIDRRNAEFDSRDEVAESSKLSSSDFWRLKFEKSQADLENEKKFSKDLADTVEDLQGDIQYIQCNNEMLLDKINQLNFENDDLKNTVEILLQTVFAQSVF